MKGLVVCKLGQKAIDEAIKAKHGYAHFVWRMIGKLFEDFSTSSERDKALPRSMFDNPEEWHNWLYQVSWSKTGVTPALYKLMPQEDDQEADDELLLKFCMDVYMQYPSLSPEEAAKKAWKILRGRWGLN